MTYQDTIELLNSLIYFERPPFDAMLKSRDISKGISLERQKILLELLGNPENDLKIVLVAGTSGKGSVTTMFGHLLSKGGFKTGVHVSPHLSTPRERLCISGEIVTKEKFVEVFETVWKKVTQLHQEYELGMPSYFEIILAMALLYFNQEECDYVVLEAGLGGKLDGVNAVKNPIMSIITPIGKDHVEVLGKTLAAIATDKSQIMRKNTPVIIADQKDEVEKLIVQIAQNSAAQPTKVVKPQHIQTPKLNSTTFEWQGKHFQLPFTGDHFAANAAVALTACNILNIAYKQSTGVFDDLFLPGRSEIIFDKPILILDAAHNPHKMNALVNSLQVLKANSFGIVFTCMADKECEGMLQYLKKLQPKKIWISRPLHGPRPVYSMRRMKELAQEMCSDVEITYSPQEALDAVRKSDLEQVLITGSMYYLGEMRSLLCLGEQD